MSDGQGWQAPGAGAPGDDPGDRPYDRPYDPPRADAGRTSAPPAWTPPPKPGLVPLRPLGFGTLIGAPFQALKRNPKATFGSALLVQGAVLLVSLVVVGGVTAFATSRIAMARPEDVDAVAAGSIAGVLASALVPIALSVVGSALLQGVIVLEVARAVLGERLRLGQLWSRVRRRLGALVLWVLLLGAAVIAALAVLVAIVATLVALGPLTAIAGILVAVLGGLGLVVLGVWLITKTSLVPSAIVLERRGVRSAIARSWRLTDGYFWRTFGAELLVAVIVNTVGQVVAVPASLVFTIATAFIAPTSGGELNGGAVATAIASYALMLLVSLVVGAVAAVVQSAVVALIHLDLRMRKEGLDLELVRFVERRAAGEAPADPFEPENAAAAWPPPGAA